MSISPTVSRNRRAFDAAPCSPKPRIRTVGIIGAGVMGSAIAAASVRCGFRVRITDIVSGVATNAVREILATSPSRAFCDSEELRSPTSPPIRVATSDADLAAADLVIESIPEDPVAKKEVLSRIDPHLGSHSLVASNTSSIPISELADVLRAPDRFCGLHFCHPVNERPLVEVVASNATSLATTEQAAAYAVTLGKSPVVVRDGPGFVLNRILSPYFTEALELLLEGVEVDVLNQAAREFGMPCGPLRQLDEFGIDVTLAVGSRLFRTFPDRSIPSELLIAVYKTGRRGCKSGGGFSANVDDPDCDEIAPVVRDIIAQRSRKTRDVTFREVTPRLVLPMFLESTRILKEAIVDDSVLIDTILRDGLGMTSEYRGLFGWADEVGADTLLEWSERLQALGKRYAPTPLLLASAARESSWPRRS